MGLVISKDVAFLSRAGLRQRRVDLDRPLNEIRYRSELVFDVALSLGARSLLDGFWSSCIAESSDPPWRCPLYRA